MNFYLQRFLTKCLLQGHLLKNLGWQRRNLPVLQRIQLKTVQMLFQGFQRQQLPVLNGFLVPSELLHLYGLAPMSTEYLAPILAVTDRSSPALESTENQGFSRDTCSFHRATLGAALQGMLPQYSFIIATSHLCDGQNKTLEDLARRTSCPYLLLDVPQEISSEAIDYLAKQLQELGHKLEDMTKIRPSEQDWQQVFTLSNQTRQLMIKVNELRKNRPCPLYGKDAFNLSLLSMLMLGTPFLASCYQDLIRELQAYTPDPESPERYRILWLLAYPYFKGNFVDYMEDALGIRAIADELSAVFWSPLDVSNPYRSLARKMLENPNLGPVSNRINLIKTLVHEYEVDGVIHYSHWGCRQGCGGVQPIADTLNQLDIPFMELHGDCIDPRQESSGQTRTRLEGFRELMSQSRAAKKKHLTQHKEDLFLGIDIGSMTCKAVLINGQGQIIAHQLLLTGGSNRQTLNKLKQEIFPNKGQTKRIKGCVATGYGRSIVDFADEQLTEITCHARGMASQIKGTRTIIDIGGQDTKAIAVNSSGQVQKFVMNDKCAAGTGRFLEMMARTLEVDLNDLGPMALQAKKPAPISSLCTVFAESEVISLIAEETPVELIARGVCSSVAQRTLSMLERVGKEQKIAMTGGVAKNLGVVKELERLLKTTLEIPQEPQIIGALGAALLARDARQ